MENIEKVVAVKLQNVQDELNTRKEVILKEIIDIVIEDIYNNAFKFVEFISEKYEPIQAPYYKFSTKYKNYTIIIDKRNYIFLYKKFLWKKIEIIPLYQFSVLIGNVLSHILKDRFIAIKLSE